MATKSVWSSIMEIGRVDNSPTNSLRGTRIQPHACSAITRTSELNFTAPNNSATTIDTPSDRLDERASRSGDDNQAVKRTDIAYIPATSDNLPVTIPEKSDFLNHQSLATKTTTADQNSGPRATSNRFRVSVRMRTG